MVVIHIAKAIHEVQQASLETEKTRHYIITVYHFAQCKWSVIET